MDAKQELKILRPLSRLLTDGGRQTKKQTAKRTVVYAVAWITMVFAFMLVMQSGLINLLAVAMGSFAGVLAGVAIYSGLAAKQWPVIKPHISTESIATRIKQLET